ncbi:MAG: DUF2851 family protein [Saprospiraceae bacterium]
MQITEDLLYYIWKFRYYDFNQLATTSMETIEIVDPGNRNPHSGPDFLLAKIKINNQLWVGNVEIHVNASDWGLHQHESDRAYNNVILHVVWNQDKEVKNSAGLVLPSLELKSRVNPNLIATYSYLMENQSWVPCEKSIGNTSDITRHSWLQRLMAERLEHKSKRILLDLESNNGDWESVCYQKLARALGGKVNNDPMEMLSRITPLNIIQKHRDYLLQIEALLYGQSGLLDTLESDDEYPQKLRREFQFLQKKYDLKALNPVQWKFLRMRPANFPTIRIAQLARILYQTDHLFSKFLSAKNTKEIVHMLDVTVSHYWKNHYSFKSESSAREKHLGKDTISTIIINTVAPLLFAYGISIDNEQYKEKAVDFLSELKPEKNSIISGWTNIGWMANTAMDSQALIELKNNFCDQKRCIACSIGHQLLKSKL